jgi:hypothetical protein
MAFSKTFGSDELKLESHSKSAEPKSSVINIVHEEAEWPVF